MPSSNLNAGLNLNVGLPPKRAPGQPPLSTTLNAPAGQPPWASSPSSPAATPSMASLDMPAGLSGTGLPNQSRLIPGAPALPNMAPTGGSGGMPGMLHTLQGSSLLGRDVSPSPASSVTQPLNATGAPSLNFGAPLGQDPASAAPMAPIPSGRSIASLRAPRGTNFIRLAFAAIFLLGFLGLVGFLLKDHLMDLIPSLTGHDVAEETSKEEPGNPIQLLSNPDPGTPSKLSSNAIPEKPSPSSEAPAKSAPKTAGFDPLESTPSKATSVAPKEQVATALPSSAPSAASAAPMAASPVPPAAGTLLEVPAKPAMNAESSSAPAASPSSLGQSHTIEEEDVPAAAQPAVEALKKFLNSKSLEERLKYTLGADMMKPHMERYYAHAPDGPILVDRIQFVRMDPNPELGSGKHCILSLENKTWEFSVPVMLEEKEDGFKVDWVAFVEFKDRMLEKFFQTYMTGKACFHVGIIRHHYFGDGVPNLDHKDVFRVGPAPPNSFQESVFLDKDSALAQELRVRIPWETHVWAVVELEWKKLGSQQWVELSAVPQMHWYSLPMAPKDNSPPQKTAAAEELPPGISKNGSRSKTGAPPTNNMPPPGIRKSSPNLPDTIKRPIIPGGR